jgi:hypothetical protein
VYEEKDDGEATPIVAALEHPVPHSFGDLDARHELPSNSRVHFAFAALRIVTGARPEAAPLPLPALGKSAAGAASIYSWRACSTTTPPAGS